MIRTINLYVVMIKGILLEKEVSVSSQVCCSPVVVPVIRDKISHGYCHLFFIFSFLSSLYSHCIFYQQSPSPICYCCSTFSSYSFHISLSASSHRILRLPRSIFPPLSGHLLCLTIVHLTFFHMSISTYSSPVYSENIPSLQPPLLVCSFFSSALFTPMIPLIQLFPQTCTFGCFSVRAIVSKPYMYAGLTHEVSTFP